MKLIENYKWRYATKKFDPNKKIADEELKYLKEMVQLSASSYGLQAYKILVISDKKIREKLREHSYNQAQITDSNYLFVFCAYNEVDIEYITNFVKMKSVIQEIDLNQLQELKNNMINSICSKSPDDIKAWTGKQCYIALANLLTACAELNIDACPMEGFEAKHYNKILKLDEQGLSATVIAAVGHRTDDDIFADLKKLRKPLDRLFKDI